MSKALFIDYYNFRNSNKQILIENSEAPLLSIIGLEDSPGLIGKGVDYKILGNLDTRQCHSFFPSSFLRCGDLLHCVATC